MDALTAIQVRRVSNSEDLMVAGDYVFIPSRPPKVVTETIPLDPPRGWFKRLWWNLFGTKSIVKESKEEVWPAYDTVIMVCPTCNQPLATSAKHAITSVEPLTIESPVTCPYCRTVTFKVKEGTLMPA
jgi:uncharacterized protein YbaR (Trm112 family)